MAQAHRELQPGEHVSWNYGAGHAKGQVVEKLTENTKLGSRVFKASPDDPTYLVKSDTSGKEAIKKPETLHKIDEDAHDADKNSSKDAPKESSQGGREEVGTKEKRDGLKERSTNEEKEEARNEETAMKVADTGKGSAGASGKAVKSKREQQVTAGAEDAAEDKGEQNDASFRPTKDELEAPDDEEEVLAQDVEEELKEEGIKPAGDEGMIDTAEDEDHAAAQHPEGE